MALSMAQKLRLKEGMTVLAINPPDGFNEELTAAISGVKVSAKAKVYDQLHWFVKNKAEMEKGLDKLLSLLKDDVLCWIYYPKGTSKIQTDLTRDKGWENLLAHQHLQWVTLVSFNDTWSAFAIRVKNDSDKKKETVTKERAIFNWVDPATKTVTLPDDVAKAFKQSKQAASFFNSLSFTNKKEYLEWIVTARHEVTRTERINGTIERLEKGWKNPRNL